MTEDVEIRLARPEDVEAVANMLARLAGEIGDGDAFSSTPEVLRRYGFGPGALFSCCVAGDGSGPVGLALFFRHFSTTRGQPGVYVQDLWVSPEQRGRGLGQDLLGAVAHHAAQTWQAKYLALTTYRDNPGATRFYQRLGFAAHENDLPMAASGATFRKLEQNGRAAG